MGIHRFVSAAEVLAFFATEIEIFAFLCWPIAIFKFYLVTVDDVALEVF
jgi:hypothetical protein